MKFVLFAMIVVAHLAIGDAIQCYNCTYPPTVDCGAAFGKDGKGVVVTECDSSTTRCGKAVFGLAIGRGCLPVNEFLTEDKDLHFCESDLCNGASSIDLTLATIMVLVPALVLGS